MAIEHREVERVDSLNSTSIMTDIYVYTFQQAPITANEDISTGI